MIAFRDFVPQPQRKRLLGMLTDYENLHELVGRVNQWVEQENIRVINVETVLLNSLPANETDESPVRMDSSGTTFSTYQIIRVWYYQPLVDPQRAYTGHTERLSLGES
jgi:hypothetical protein